jgi:hypothetical protein
MASLPARAQSPDRPVVGHVAAGYAEPVGTAGYFSPGWNVSGGATFRGAPKAPVGLRLDLGYSRFNAENQVIESESGITTSRADEGYASMTDLLVGGVCDFGGGGHVAGHVGAGIGGYSRYWNLTQTILTSGVYCDPLGGICFASTAGDVIDNSGRLTKLGYNVNLGIGFPLERRGEVYIEASYHRMSSDPTTEFVPIVMGYRW